MFKEVEIEMPDCTNELHNYRRLSSYAPQSYLVSTTIESDNNSLSRESCKRSESPYGIFNKDCDEKYRPDIEKTKFCFISPEAENKFLGDEKTLSKILYLLRYEEMSSWQVGPKEIKIQVEYYDGETSIYETFKNDNF